MALEVLERICLFYVSIMGLTHCYKTTFFIFEFFYYIYLTDVYYCTSHMSAANKSHTGILLAVSIW